MMIIILCIVGVVVLVLLGLAGFLMMLYNSLVSLRTLVEEAWSGIDVQLKKRYDLIPNLVETVKGYAKHENKTFEKIAELRSNAMNAKSVEEKGKYEGELTNTLKTLFAVAENYPELKANTNFLELQTTLGQIETEIEGARRYYNGTVRNYNIKIAQFPASIFAGMFNFVKKEFFEVENEVERKNVKVDFSDMSEPTVEKETPTVEAEPKNEE